MLRYQIFAVLACLCSTAVAAEPETLPPLADGRAPQNYDQMWAGFDPRAEPLETEVLHEWEEDGVVMRVVRFRIGIFKGTKAKLAAIYGFPKAAAGGKQKLPGLLQIHGGGQYADYRACLTNSQRGYATLAIAWAGRINAPEYRVTPVEVKLFWDGKTDDPRYKLTTDWGAVDGYHAPSRNPGNVFPSARPHPWTLDPVESPRNSGWFLCALAARRALTFLERQPEVDPDRLGVYGHSMGGKLTVMTAPDPRVQAAAPSCGGISDRYNDSPLFRKTLGDDVSLRRITCPIIFLCPANDFHGRIGDLPKAIREIKSKDWRVTCSPHRNHQDPPEFEVAGLLWFDHHLKQSFSFPRTPSTELKLQTDDGVPVLTVRPDRSRPIRSVEVYYTQQGRPNERPEDREHTMHRFWHYARPEPAGDGVWTARLPLHGPDRPLWVFANVLYALDEPVTGAGYYYRVYTTDAVNVSSLLKIVSPEELAAAGVRPALKPSLVIEDFQRPDWEKEWFTYRPDEWARMTNKPYDPMWKAPPGARLALDVRSAEKNKLVILLDDYAAEVELAGGDRWQSIELAPADFKDYDGRPLADWSGIRQLKLSPAEHLHPPRRRQGRPRLVGAHWKGDPPQFRNLRWVVAAKAGKPQNAGGGADSAATGNTGAGRPPTMPEDRAGETPALPVHVAGQTHRLGHSTSLTLRVPDSRSRRPDAAAQQQLLDVFPPSTADVPAERRGRTEFSSRFVPSGSLWDERLDERQVFHLEIRHQQDPSNSFRLRLGKGGQIYSLRGPFGESVPPSWRPPDSDLSPWNDEVWQFVAVCTRYNGVKASLKAGPLPDEVVRRMERSPYSTSFFVHGSGAYIPRDAAVRTLYCPLLATDARPDERTYRMLNWGLVPQLRTVHRSPILFYTQVRDVGDGVIELTWAVHNFSDRDDVIFDHLNAPWGGTRVSSLPLRYVSTPDGRLVQREQILNEHGVVPVRETGGWNLSCATDADDSPALALVFGRDRHWDAERRRAAAGLPHVQFAPSVYRDWRAAAPLYKTVWKDWATRPENSFRNYDVCEVIPRLRIEPGQTIWYRSFLVVGPKRRVIELARSLVPHVDYGRLTFDPAETPTTTLAGIGPRPLTVYARPVPGTRPLFVLRNLATGRRVVTTDPYLFVKKEPVDFGFPPEHPHADYYGHAVGYRLDEHNTDWEALLGFVSVGALRSSSIPSPRGTKPRFPLPAR